MKPLCNLKLILNGKWPHFALKLLKQDRSGTEITKGKKRMDGKFLFNKDRAWINKFIQTNRNFHWIGM